jgi:glutamyl endopeptidase
MRINILQEGSKIVRRIGVFAFIALIELSDAIFLIFIYFEISSYVYTRENSKGKYTMPARNVNPIGYYQMMAEPGSSGGAVLNSKNDFSHRI